MNGALLSVLCGHRSGRGSGAAAMEPSGGDDPSLLPPGERTPCLLLPARRYALSAFFFCWGVVYPTATWFFLRNTWVRLRSGLGVVIRKETNAHNGQARI